MYIYIYKNYKSYKYNKIYKYIYIKHSYLVKIQNASQSYSATKCSNKCKQNQNIYMYIIHILLQ